MCVENSSVFPAPHVRVVFGCQNVVFASDCNATVDCSVGAKKTSTYEVPIGSKYCGRINIDIFGIKVYDWMGITAKKLRPHGYSLSVSPFKYGALTLCGRPSHAVLLGSSDLDASPNPGE